MLSKNNVQNGMLTGSILPVVSLLMFEVFTTGKHAVYKPGLPYFIAAAINLILLRYYARKHHEKTAQGIVLVTFVFMILIYLFRFKQ